LATPASRSRRGFTLLELVLVLLIVALVAALVQPVMRNAGRRLGVYSADYELLALLRQARWWAGSTGRTCLVHLRPTPGGYAAVVEYLEPGQDTPRPLRAEWAGLAQPAAVRMLLKIPPDRGISRRRELTVRFTPWGVEEDYVIALDDASGASGGRDGRGPARRIEVRRPSGLVWLVPGDVPGPLDRASIRAVEEYWRANCRGAGA